MENASKALIMAGSILVAILVIGLLVFGYQNLSEVEQTKTDVEDNSKISEFMQRFEQFNRNPKDNANPLYGSELLSLANLQEDYNKREADDGYQEIEITVVISAGVTGSEYFKAGTYRIEQIANQQKQIENKIAKYEKSNSKYNNKSVKYYSQKTYREIAIDFGMEPPSDMADYDIPENYLQRNSTTSSLLQEIQEYTNIKTEYEAFRTGKKFYCTEVKYDDYNGRITSMRFEETN